MESTASSHVVIRSAIDPRDPLAFGDCPKYPVRGCDAPDFERLLKRLEHAPSSPARRRRLHWCAGVGRRCGEDLSA